VRRDPHSVTDFAEGRTTDLHLDLKVDPAARRFEGTAILHFDRPHTGPLHLDARDLHIEGIDDGSQPLPWSWGEADPVLGRPLRIERPAATDTVRIRYRAADDASALVWLDPSQTTGKPFMLTQCQAIHARSIVPLQDTPAARIRYTAVVEVPEGLSAVMSASPPQADSHGRLHFTMPQPIPPYLLALAVGDLDSRDLGPRTRVYAEPAVVEKAAWEFADAEAMLEAAEKLFGPYAWDRYDFVVLPPSFPMGGMENPRMTFLTPTLIAGDRSLVNVLAHELAHSWTGNLVTNADNEHFWLNEGWTVWAERRILEVLEGAEASHQQATLARARLDDVMTIRHDAGQSTALVYDQRGLDPDEEFCLVPYEKGCLLLTAIERAVGRPRFDAFVQAYIERFAFQTLTTDDFVAFLTAQLPDHGVDLDRWLYQDGLPDDAPTFPSSRLDDLAERGLDGAPDTVVEKLFVLANHPPSSVDDAERYADAWGLRTTTNAELECAWLAAAIRCGVDVDEQLSRFLGTVGRTKLLTPVVWALVDAGRKEEARRHIDAQRARLHVSTRRALDPLLA
jgi:aminopeptidase N